LFNVKHLSVSTPGTSPEDYVLFTGVGFTGAIIWVCAYLMFSSSLKAVRHAKFEIFWYTHHLFVAFFAFAMVHGSFCFIKADKGPACGEG
jgi:NADPH oxidase